MWKKYVCFHIKNIFVDQANEAIHKKMAVAWEWGLKHSSFFIVVSGEFIVVSGGWTSSA